MLKYRVITALILIPIVIAALFLLPPAGFGLVIIAISGLAGWEWAQFIGWHSQGKRIATGMGFAALLLIMQLSLPNFDHLLDTPMIKNGLWAGLIWWVAAILLVVSYPNSANMWKNSVFIKLLFGILTIVPFYCGMMALRMLGYSTDTYTGAWWLLYVMILVWAADSGAYAFGRLMGKHKMAPKVSPGKTLEGLVGGLITAGVASWLFTHFALGSLLPLLGCLRFGHFPLLVLCLQ